MTTYASDLPDIVVSNNADYEEAHNVLDGDNGSSYVSLQNANTGHQPDTSPTWWQLVAQKGDTGSVSGDPQYASTVTAAQRALRVTRLYTAATFP